MYEYLCPKCRNQFELVRPMSDSEKSARCPNCSSEARRLISGLRSETGGPTQPAGESLSKRTAVEEEGLGSACGQTRHVAYGSLLQMLEELASRVRSLGLQERQAASRVEALERERNEAVALARTLQRQVSEMAALITLAGDKVEEMLKVGATDDVSQQDAVGTCAESKVRSQLGEFSADIGREPKERSDRPSRSS